MIGDFLKKKTHLGKKKKKGPELEAEEYIDLTDMVEEEKEDIEADTLIKIAEVHRYEDVRDISETVYDGNILLVDIESIAGNQEAVDRIQRELKAIANDVSGDIAGVGQNYIAVTPADIGIDKEKIKPF